MEEKVFISESFLNNYFRAKTFEKAGEWEKARQLWKHEGRMEDVAAIDMILEATRLGDEYRSLVAPYYEQLEKREINNSQFHELTAAAHIQVYGTPY